MLCRGEGGLASQVRRGRSAARRCYRGPSREREADGLGGLSPGPRPGFWASRIGVLQAGFNSGGPWPPVACGFPSEAHRPTERRTATDQEDCCGGSGAEPSGPWEISRGGPREPRERVPSPVFALGRRCERPPHRSHSPQTPEQQRPTPAPDLASNKLPGQFEPTQSPGLGPGPPPCRPHPTPSQPANQPRLWPSGPPS